jgi:hypothetical protein
LSSSPYTHHQPHRYVEMRKSPQYKTRSIIRIHEQAPAQGAHYGPHRLATTAELDTDFLIDLLRSTPVAKLAPATPEAAASDEPSSDNEDDLSDGDGGDLSDGGGDLTGDGDLASDAEDAEVGDESSTAAGGESSDGADDAMEGVEGAAAAVAVAGVAAAVAVAAANGANGGVKVKAAVQRAMDYVQGLLWTLSMYFSGGEALPRVGLVWFLRAG